MAVGDQKILEMSDKVNPEIDGDQSGTEYGRQCFEMAEPKDVAYKTSYDRTGHGKRSEDKEYQTGNTVFPDIGLIFPCRFFGTFKKIMQGFVGNDLQPVPALYKQRIEQQDHNSFDKKTEEDQQNGIHLLSDPYGETGHSAKDDIGSSDTQECLKRMGEKEGAEQDQQEKDPQHTQPEYQDLSFCMTEK